MAAKRGRKRKLNKDADLNDNPKPSKRARKDDKESNTSSKEQKSVKHKKEKDEKNTNLNIELIEIFKELAEYEYAQKQRFKGNAYRNVENKLRKLSFKVTCGSKVKHLPGFGNASVNKIDEYLQHKKVKRLEIYRTEYGTVENCKLKHKSKAKKKKK